MLERLKRRMFCLERAIPVPLTALRLFEQARDHARRTGLSLEAALVSLVAEVSHDDLHRLAEELGQMAFGGDAVARDEAKRQALASSR